MPPWIVFCFPSSFISRGIDGSGGREAEAPSIEGISLVLLSLVVCAPRAPKGSSCAPCAHLTFVDSVKVVQSFGQRVFNGLLPTREFAVKSVYLTEF